MARPRSPATDVDPQPAEASTADAAAPAALPAWALRFAPPEPAAQRYASPSTLAESERGPAPSPLAERQGLGRYRRGLIIHRLLQLLPDLPAAGAARGRGPRCWRGRST